MHVINLFTIPYTGVQTLQNFLIQFNIHNSIAIGEELNPLVWNLVTGAIDPKNTKEMQRLSKYYKCVTPLRDPLLTLISARTRNPEGDITAVLRSWIFFMKEVIPFTPFLLPLDVLKTPEDREQALIGLVEHFELQWVDNWGDKVDEMVEKWPETNSLGAYPLKLAYYNKDLAFIKKSLKKEFESLQAIEPLLRPLLEDHGYKDLLWYSTPSLKEAA